MPRSGSELARSSLRPTLTLREGLDEPRRLPQSAPHVDLEPAPGAKWWAGAVIAGAAVLYVIFW